MWENVSFWIFFSKFFLCVCMCVKCSKKDKVTAHAGDTSSTIYEDTNVSERKVAIHNQENL